MSKGLKDFTGILGHIYLIYVFFIRQKGSAFTVTPFMDSTERGVFATRSPPEGLTTLGLSIVSTGPKLRMEILTVKGIDVLDETPLLDIKPYIRKFRFRVEKTALSGWDWLQG